jgi:tetratricopeptide (TPR) repeat protein
MGLWYRLVNCTQLGTALVCRDYQILQNNINALDKIYALNPNDKTAQREQAVNYERVGDLYLDLLGDIQKALSYQQQALDISQKIAQQDPTNSAAQRDLWVSFEKLGDILRLNQTDKALKLHQQALDISQKIAQQDSTNSAAQRDLSLSFEKLGDIHLALNQTDKALAY